MDKTKIKNVTEELYIKNVKANVANIFDVLFNNENYADNYLLDSNILKEVSGENDDKGSAKGRGDGAGNCSVPAKRRSKIRGRYAQETWRN